MKVLIINRQQVKELLPMRACMKVLANTFRAYSRGEAVQPLRTMMKVPDSGGILAPMPGYDGASKALAVKLITVFHNEGESKFDSHQGLVVLFSAKYGNPLAIMDAIEITAIRTAAASGVATEALAREEAAILAILGSGVQARSHFTAMTEARNIQSVRIWSQTRENAQKLAEELSDQPLVKITVSESAQTAVTGAHIVCTVTSATEPILEGSWLSPGTHINAVGSSMAKRRELDSEAVINSKLYVDSRESATNEAGDFLIPFSEGAVSHDHILGEIGEVLEGTADGRQSVDEITLFKSLGMAVEDVAAAQYIYSQAQEKGCGVWVDM